MNFLPTSSIKMLADITDTKEHKPEGEGLYSLFEVEKAGTSGF